MVPNHLLNGMILQVGILAHLLRMVMEPKYDLKIFEGDWTPFAHLRIWLDF